MIRSFRFILNLLVALALVSLAGAPIFSAQQTINVGTTANDHTGDTLRASFGKVNSNFTELYGGSVPYVAGNYFTPYFGAQIVTGAVLGANSIRCTAFMLRAPATVSDMGARVTSSPSAGNFQKAVYANNSTTFRPTGNALAVTGSLSTAANGVITGDITGANVALPTRVILWDCTNTDNATVKFAALTDATVWDSGIGGSATAANVFSSGTNAQITVAVSQTFGTWPDMTSASFTEQLTGGHALIVFKAA